MGLCTGIAADGQVAGFIDHIIVHFVGGRAPCWWGAENPYGGTASCDGSMQIIGVKYQSGLRNMVSKEKPRCGDEILSEANISTPGGGTIFGHAIILNIHLHIFFCENGLNFIM